MQSEEYARVLKMRTYDYVDKMLYDMQGRMEDLNLKYFGEMYANLRRLLRKSEACCRVTVMKSRRWRIVPRKGKMRSL